MLGSADKVLIAVVPQNGPSAQHARPRSGRFPARRPLPIPLLDVLSEKIACCTVYLVGLTSFLLPRRTYLLLIAAVEYTSSSCAAEIPSCSSSSAHSRLGALAYDGSRKFNSQGRGLRVPPWAGRDQGLRMLVSRHRAMPRPERCIANAPASHYGHADRLAGLLAPRRGSSVIRHCAVQGAV